MINFKAFKALQVAIVCICLIGPIAMRCIIRERYYPVDVVSVAAMPRTGDAAIVDFREIKGFGNNRTKLFTNHVLEGGLVSSLDTVEVDRIGFRLSISDYARSSKSYIFGLLYGIAASLFLYNGIFIYSKKAYVTSSGGLELKLDPNGTWYNIVLGILLILVVLVPNHEWPKAHIVVSILFVASNVIVLGFFGNIYERPAIKKGRIIMALIMVFAFILTRVKQSFFRFTILDYEWVALALISFHLLTVLFSLPDKDEVTLRSQKIPSATMSTT